MFADAEAALAKEVTSDWLKFHLAWPIVLCDYATTLPRCGLFVGSLALSLREVVSVRQKVETSSAVHAVQAISALLKERSMGNDALLHQISDYASAAVTPGTSGSFGNSLKVVAKRAKLQHRASLNRFSRACRTPTRQ